MASDSFTAANNTALSSHAAGGNTWAGCGQTEASGEIQGNAACADGDDFFAVSARATNSSVDFSQVVFKAGAYLGESKSVNVRSSASTAGYYMQVSAVTGDNITSISLRKGEGFLSTFTTSLSRLADHTFALKATPVAGGVELRGYIDGSPVTWDDTDANTASPSQVFTDLTAESPLSSGNPGFVCLFFDGIDATNSGFDDWTDVEPSGGGTVEITSIDDVTLTHGQTGVTITGTGFGASQGTGRVVVSPTDNIADGSAVDQTVTSWSDTSIDFTAVLSSFAFGTTLYVFVENDDDEINADGESVSRIVASATLNFTGSDKFIDETGAPQASITNMTFYVWRSPRPTGAPDQTFTSQATDSNGEISLSLTLGALDDGDTVFFLGFTPDGTDLFCAGEKLPVYA